MKKHISIIPLLLLVILLLAGCSRSQVAVVDGNTYKARFEIKAICSNYTFSVVEGNIDPNLVEASWTDPVTHKIYRNAFGISNSCDLPRELKEGDTFYFKLIQPFSTGNCAVCEAYYPTPGKKLYIQVIQ
jgi:hypothetical protein